MKRRYLVLDEEKRNKETRKKANRIITLDGENNRKVKCMHADNMTLVSETSHEQNHCGNHKAALNKKPTDSPQ